MTRRVLVLLVSVLVLGMGTLTAFVQSKNFALAAELDALQQESEWYVRRRTKLFEELERKEFEATSADRTPRLRPAEPVPHDVDSTYAAPLVLHGGEL